MNFTITTASDRNAVKGYIDKLVDGKRYTVNITTKRERRTIDQNRLLFLWINCISSETGQDKDELHAFFKQKFIGFTAIEVFGSKTFIEPTTTKLDTKQFSDYLEKIQAFASAELGIALPNPEDMIWAQFYEQYSGHI